MKRKQERTSISLYSFAILALIVVLPLLFFINNGDSSQQQQQQLLQKPGAKDTTTNTTSKSLNTTGQAASQTAESLVRSIMSPSSLMSSIINETGRNTSNSSGTGHGQLKGSTTQNNMTNAAATTTKNGNTPTSSSSSPSSPSSSSSSLSTLSSATNQSNSNGSNTSTSVGQPNKQGNNMQNTIVRNVDTLLLAHQIIPAKDFIPLYDTSPYEILNGHMAAKIPCDANSAPSLQILVGHLPDLRPVQLQLDKEFSQPGNICMYHVDIGSTTTTMTHNNNGRGAVGGGGQDNGTINTNLVLRNPTDYRIILPNTSTIVIGVNEIMPIDIPTDNSHSALSQPVASSNSNHPSYSQESKGQISSIINSITEMNKPATK